MSLLPPPPRVSTPDPRTCDAPASDDAGRGPLGAQLGPRGRQTHGPRVGVGGHATPLLALQPQQSDVVLPALAQVLPVDHDALRGKASLEVVLLHRVVVA